MSSKRVGLGEEEDTRERVPSRQCVRVVELQWNGDGEWGRTTYVVGQNNWDGGLVECTQMREGRETESGREDLTSRSDPQKDRGENGSLLGKW